MKPVRIAPKAAGDLEEIYAFLEREAGEEQAGTTVRRILDRLKQLATFPGMGVLRRLDHFEWRVFSEGEYLIYYRERDEMLELFRVIHGRRNQPTALLESLEDESDHG